MEAALRDAKLDLKDLNEVILVGGSTRIPAVIDLVRPRPGRPAVCRLGRGSVLTAAPCHCVSCELLTKSASS